MHEQGGNVPVQMPCVQPGMRSSRSSSSWEVQPNVAGAGKHDLAEQPIVAVAGQPNLAGQLAPASGMRESPGGRLSKEEVCLLNDRLVN